MYCCFVNLDLKCSMPGVFMEVEFVVRKDGFRQMIYLAGYSAKDNPHAKMVPCQPVDN